MKWTIYSSNFQLVRLGNHQFLIVFKVKNPAILGELSIEPQNPQNHRVAMDFTPWFLDPLPLLNPPPPPKKKTSNSRKWVSSSRRAWKMCLSDSVSPALPKDLCRLHPSG